MGLEAFEKSLFYPFYRAASNDVSWNDATNAFIRTCEESYPQYPNRMASRSRGTAPSVDSSRRTFRGNAGPTDRRLNKHQARRRKQTPSDDSTKVNKYGDHDEKRETIVVEQNEDESVENAASDKMEQEVEAPPSPAEKEIQHLLRRLANVQESIQLSTAANVNPSTWQQNVLNPVGNCVREWRAIVKHYHDELDPATDCKAPALALFQLIQMSLQSGPLAGAKPGYFKRCGANVARQALDFLDGTVPNKQEATFLCFTKKQGDAIEKWRDNATKAVENDKPPSESALKKQSKAKKKK